MNHPLREEALWAFAATGPIRDESDTALLFVSWNALDANLSRLREVWDHPRTTHAVAIKTQPHPAVLAHMAELGFGLEAASWEEVQLALNAGCPPERLVFDSPVKTRAEIAQCAAVGPGMLVNANSLAELPRLAPYSDRLRIGLRLNPMVATDSPDLFDVSRDDSKFGEPIANADAVLSAIRGFPVTALHVHPSSSMTSVDAAVRAVESVVALAIEANVQACESGNDRRIRVIDVGGGLAPEDPDGTDGSLMEEYARTLRDRLPELWSEFDLVTEFGQWVHFHTGYAASDVEYVVDRADRQVAFVHLGADFLLRDVYVRPRGIRWLPVRGGRAIEGAAQPTDLAGPLCFAGDFLARDIELPRLREGDHLIMLGTGSNALGLWSRHTSRDVPAVVGVDFAGRSLQVLSERFSPFVEPLG